MAPQRDAARVHLRNGSARERGRVDLPDASRRSCAIARAAARSAAWRSSRALRSRGEAENPELVDMSRRFWFAVASDRAARAARDGRHAAGAADLVALSRARAGAAGARAGHADLRRGRRWPFYVRAIAVGEESQLEHVHADRARRERGVRLQHARGARARRSSRCRSAATAARCRCTSRRPRSSSR